MINGKNYDWEDVKIFLNGVPIGEITEINYTDEKERDFTYGPGSRPTAIGNGNLKASGDLTLKRASYDEINQIARAAGKNIYDFKPFLIVAAYGAKTISEDSQFVDAQYSPLSTDTLQNVMFIKRTQATKQNDKENTVKLDFIFEPPIR